MRTGLAFLMATLILLTPLSGAALQPTSQPSAYTTDDWAALFDELMPARMNAAHLPGGVVSVVQDGRLVFAKGYGYADVAGRRPVVADRWSPTRPCSAWPRFRSCSCGRR